MHRNEKKYELGEMATDSKLINFFDKLVTTDTRLSIFSKKNHQEIFTWVVVSFYPDLL